MTDAIVEGVGAGNRRWLARAITLVESTRPDHQQEARTVLQRLLARTGTSIRVGISGAPGVGKSTFIESFGLHLVGGDRRLAVLAVDPTSGRSGGSILGDKTRMPELAKHPLVFVRPSPSGDAIGGVARRTREALLMCEAWGADVVIVETVGTGQSDTAVAEMVDLFMVLVGPGGGDELQGIKRGALELADVIVVTKADGELAAEAGRVAADHRGALQLLRRRHRGWEPKVVLTSALTGEGNAEVWAAVQEHHHRLDASGELALLRSAQAVSWMWTEINDRVMAGFRGSPAVRARATELEQLVADGECTPAMAADDLLDAYWRK